MRDASGDVLTSISAHASPSCYLHIFNVTTFSRTFASCFYSVFFIYSNACYFTMFIGNSTTFTVLNKKNKKKLRWYVQQTVNLGLSTLNYLSANKQWYE